MKKKIITPIILMALLVIMNFSCKPPKDLSSHYNYESECVGVDLDGSQTLKVWGTGRTRAYAIEMAKKNGVRDILFKGIRNGKSDCNVKPILTEVNVQEKYEAYFNKFFSSDGSYKTFVSTPKGGLITTTEVEYKGSSKTSLTYSIIINVNRSALKTKMIQDNILF